MIRGSSGIALFALALSVGQVARAQPCCGPVTPQGRALAQVLDTTGVEHLWLAGRHVDWRTGKTNRPEPGGPEAKTHCSAFVAAVAERLGVYILRPPQHRQELLANAQLRWLDADGAATGWGPVADVEQAQTLANRGALVVAAYRNPNPHRPGHIAIVRPGEKSRAALDQDGPDEIQAGTANYLSVPLAVGFRRHRGAWPPGGPNSIRFFGHEASPPQQ